MGNNWQIAAGSLALLPMAAAYPYDILGIKKYCPRDVEKGDKRGRYDVSQHGNYD